MGKNEVFRRKETKYVLSKEMYKTLLDKLTTYIKEDKYFISHIYNIYYDTPNDYLIMKSIEGPKYKEKVRLRSYKIPELDDIVFLEIKKKYNGIVGKRRIELKLSDFYNYIDTGILNNSNEQIKQEIDYCFKQYKLEPRRFICYDRYAYVSKDNDTFRVTFDYNIKSRKDNLRLELGDKGDYLLDDNSYVMEVKALDSYPIWFTKILSELKIYPVSFSKYGKIYMKDFEEE